ncbi:MAG: hypothetical protein A3C13_00220 [Candidatus Lloydbacteria bacterium RIFCSPHIGHO2_02_FULL_50_11]|nr:MAG: hypothetical protein A3C13_00220 [Candidatus Lloydbacteria bacterium RIFCSPHIGHO2_02_FULL_50_11]
MEQREYDFKESAVQMNKQEELAELRKKQMVGEFTLEESKRYRELTSEDEDTQGASMEGLTNTEKEELSALRREQIVSTGWTPEKAKRLIELTKKLGK